MFMIVAYTVSQNLKLCPIRPIKTTFSAQIWQQSTYLLKDSGQACLLTKYSSIMVTNPAFGTFGVVDRCQCPARN